MAQTACMDVRLQVALEEAVEEGDVEKAVGLLDAGADASGLCHALDTPILDVALRRGDKAMATLLLGRGARLDQRDMDGRTRLHRSASGGDASEELVLLLELGADPNVQDGQGWAPLHFAAAYGYVENVAALLGVGADPALRTSHRLLPLDLAGKNGHETVVDWLNRAQ